MICTIAKFIIEICVLNVLYWVLCGVLIGINPSAGIRMSKIHIGKKDIYPVLSDANDKVHICVISDNLYIIIENWSFIRSGYINIYIAFLYLQSI